MKQFEFHRCDLKDTVGFLPAAVFSNGHRRTPAEEYRARVFAANRHSRGVQEIYKRPTVLRDDDDDDEYDSEMEGFIDDEEEGPFFCIKTLVAEVVTALLVNAELQLPVNSMRVISSTCRV